MMASRKHKSTAGEEEPSVFAKKSKPTPVAQDFVKIPKFS